QEARMYPVVIAATLAQVAFVIRALRRGGISSYAGAATLAIVAVATNFTAALIPVTEGIWLIYILFRSGFGPRNLESRRAWCLMAALAIAGIAFLPIVLPALRKGTGAVESGAIDWIEKPPLWAPFALFNKATGSIAFPVLAAAAIFGVIRG